MAHFAKIENGIVTQVIVVSNDSCGGDYPESDTIGAAFCADLLGGTWKQTSYNNKFRGRYAGMGYSYDAVLDVFIAPKPFPSWILNSETTEWNAPIPKPTGNYLWNESSQSWEEINMLPSSLPYNPATPPPSTPPQTGYMWVWNEDNGKWCEIAIPTE